MVQCSHYYSYNFPPNDEELKMCINIATKFKGPVLLMYPITNFTNDCNVTHVFIHPDDGLDDIKSRISAGYTLV